MDLREAAAASARRHPWEIARADFFAGILRRAGALGRPCRILDVGAGDAYLAGRVARALPPGAEVLALDAHYSDAHLRAGGPPGVTLIRERPAGRFDVLMFLDVLEHVGDDAGFLSSFVEESLAPGGVVLLSVPAWMSLFTRHDISLGHYRRYGVRQLGRVARSAGLDVAASGGLFHALLLPRALQKVGELCRGIRARPDPAAAEDRAETGLAVWNAPSAITKMVTWTLALDGTLSMTLSRLGAGLPGLSVWALCRGR